MPGHIQTVGPPNDPFDTEPHWLPTVEIKIPREPGTDRPMIVPPGGTVAVPYRRISQMADIVDQGARWLINWYLGMCAKGMAISPDLCAMASMLEWNDPDMKPIIATAHDRAGGNYKANIGTATHLAAHHGTPIESVPGELEYDVRAHRLGLREYGITITDTEVFVVNDETRSAGTFDNRAFYPMDDLGHAIGDIKTGSFDAFSWAVQTTQYARAKRVDVSTVSAGRFAERVDLDVNTDFGVIHHVPRFGGAVRFRPVNIGAAWPVALLAVALAPHQERKDWMGPDLGHLKRADVLLLTIKDAPSKAALHEIAAKNDRWLTEKMRQALNDRWNEVA